MNTKRRERAGPAPARAVSAANPLAPILVLAISAAESLLALFQWMELLVVRAGGSAVCGLSDTVNCQRVWETEFASRIHGALGVPVAGLGLVWGLATFGLSLAWAWQLLNGREGRPQAAGLKGMALLGLAAVVVFALISASAGALCLTCVATYLIVAAFALVAFRMLPRASLRSASADLKPAGLYLAAFLVAAYLLALGPGLATPRAGESGGSALHRLPQAPASRPLTESEASVVEFLSRLPPPEKQEVSNALAIFRASAAPSGPPPEPRRLLGPKDAPVKIVDWIEIRCSHCRRLNETLHELVQVVPPESVSIEPRNFPLANECNPHVPRKDPSEVSCTAAKAMICLEPTKDFWRVREALFDEQQSLTRERVLEIASTGEIGRRQLEACIASADTARRLAEDIDYAWRYQPEGTPLVVVNGRKATQSGPFLYSMALTRGDAKSPAFDRLPPPNLAAERADPTQ
ncbi:MAG TPA: thioredoxin domain-containing protein [Myxococcaceae bacterium]|nr:thioredoxin domain-containing protein [Myxococcaceae bacterium]